MNIELPPEVRSERTGSGVFFMEPNLGDEVGRKISIVKMCPPIYRDR